MIPSPSNARNTMPSIPLTVVGGFLGAGKTSLVNRVLQSAEATGLTVLVNDFGALEIDAGLIVSRHADTISLANGCVCCSIGGDLTRALLEIGRRPERPAQLLIETSGVADPGKVAQYGLVGRTYRLHGVIVVVDAEHIASQRADPQIGDTIIRQLASAHLLVLNKCDRLDARTILRRRDGLRRLHPAVPIVETRESRLPAELVLHRFANDADVGVSAAPPRHQDPAEDSLHRSRFPTWTYLPREPFRHDALERTLDALDGVLRAKGLLELVESPGRRFLLQLVGTRWTLERIDTSTMPTDRSCGLSFIGMPGVADPEAIGARLAAAH